MATQNTELRKRENNRNDYENEEDKEQKTLDFFEDD